MIDVKDVTIARAHAHLLNKDFSAKDLAEAFLARIKEKEPSVEAYTEVFDDVFDQAAIADTLLAANKASALTGIPLAVKDNILIEGRRASCGSKMLEHHTAVYDATVITKLKASGAVFLGRTNMDEFAMGSSTENSAFATTKNPWGSDRAPGGSSGGSAAAVAGAEALASLGSDTGGSIRQPAAFCGIVGLKPTYGAVSRSGLVAMASSLDQIGPLAKTVEDARILFQAIVGHDPLDSTSYPDEKRVAQAAASKEELTIGVPYHTLSEEGIDPDVVSHFKETIERYKRCGYVIREIELPSLRYALAAYYIIMPAEASTNLARFDGVRYGLRAEGDTLLEDYLMSRREGLGSEPRRRSMLGAYVLSSGYYDAYYRKAVAVRDLIRKELEDAFADVDVIMTPTTPTPAFKLGEKIDDPLAMYMSDVFTVPANIAGIPALSVPSGTVERDGETLPLGIQLMAPHFAEDVLFRVGSDLECVLVGCNTGT